MSLKHMRSLMKILSVVLFITLLSSCSTSKQELRGVILPHHNLVGKYIDETYSEIADPSVERVVILSTNHFNIGNHYIQSALEMSSSLELDGDIIEKLQEQNILNVEPIVFESEHGITVHVERLEKYFPDVKIIPIIIKWDTPQEHLDRLVQSMIDEGALDKSLLVASIDFSHFVTEEIAQKNDDRTIEWLEQWGAGELENISLDEIKALEKSIKMDTPTSTAMDSPEALYVFTQLLDKPQRLEVWKRTSSTSLLGGENPFQNTSHLFVRVW